MIFPVPRQIPAPIQRPIPGRIQNLLLTLVRPFRPASCGGLWTVLLALLPLLSCQRDHLYYASSNTATVLVEPDWTASGVHPNGVTVYAYREPDGSLYKRFPPVSAQEKCYVKLPQGDFTLVVMNDTPEEFKGRINFAGEESLATFQALGVKDETRSQKLQDHLKAMAAAAEAAETAAGASETSGSGSSAMNGSTKAEEDLYCIVEPDTLAVSVIRGLHISPEQVDYFYDRPQTDLSAETAVKVPAEPKQVVSKVNIKAHVTGLKYARGTTLSFLRGVSAGRDIGLEANSSLTAAHAFILNNRKFDPGSDSDGTITASFLSFGLVGDTDEEKRYYLDINFVLINGEDHPLTFDVTDLISVDVSLSLQLTLNLDLEIVLPEVVGEEGGGFNTDISEWEDEAVDIPI